MCVSADRLFVTSFPEIPRRPIPPVRGLFSDVPSILKVSPSSCVSFVLQHSVHVSCSSSSVHARDNRRDDLVLRRRYRQRARRVLHTLGDPCQASLHKPTYGCFWSGTTFAPFLPRNGPNAWPTLTPTSQPTPSPTPTPTLTPTWPSLHPRRQRVLFRE